MWRVERVKQWFALILVQLALCKGGAAAQAWSRPEMSLWPTADDAGSRDIYINEGESLQLTCTSRQKMMFYYPKDTPDEQIETSPVNLEEKEDIDEETNERRKISVFRRADTVHGDTGWYGCGGIEGLSPDTDGTVRAAAARGRSSSNDYRDDPYIRWTYVYVQSNSSYFVQGDSFKSFRETLGGTATIPCRPTRPDYSVKLVKEYSIIEIGGRASYDPRIGFKLSNITLKDSSYFTCSITGEDDNTQEVTFHLSVIRNQVLSEPRIIKDTLRHVTKGQTLYVNCTTDVDTDVQHTFNWTTPVQSNRITTRQYTNTIATNKETITCELIINGVIDEDQGYYECTITSFVDTKKATTFITVYDPDIKYINLTSKDKNRFYEKKYGDRVEWFVSVDAYPQPTVKWFDPRGVEIVASWTEPDRSKFATRILSSSTLLRINRLELKDIGVYSLQATNEHQIETLNFTMEVIAKPMVDFDAPFEAFYMPRESVKFYSKIAAFPAPNVSWSFLQAPNYPSLEASRLIQLENVTMIEAKQDSLFRSVVTTTIRGSGLLTCTTCNTVGCDSTTEQVIVSDVPGGFGVIQRYRTELTKGDDAKITCAASIYNYTSVEWLDENKDTLVQTDRVRFTKSRTEFTHRSDLLVKNIETSDNGTLYHCIAYMNDDHDNNASVEYKLEIYDPVVPYLSETNMNKTEITLDLSTESHKTVILKCYAEGTPLPNITWYKDEERIRSNEQYMCLHRNQELHIKYLLDENNGKYVCKAENRFGKAVNYQILTMRGKEASKVFIVLIAVLVLICILLVVYFSIKMHREKVMRKELMEAGLTHFEEGALECLNPELTVDDQAELLPYDKKWEFPREKLKFGKQLGFGAFGVVMKAEASGICDDESVTTVAVKMVRRTTESTYIRALASELKIMVHLGKHLNVVNLLGACTKNITKRELLVIVEYCRFGNLHNYLFRHRANFIDQIEAASGEIDPTIGLDILTGTMLSSLPKNNDHTSSSSVSAENTSGTTAAAERVSYDASASSARILDTSQPPDASCGDNSLATTNQPGWRSNYTGDYKDHNLKPICTQDLLSWAFQVARGMEYLSQRKVLHGDLAARNILLAENNVVKICDFGLAKTMYKDDNYKKKGDAPLPIKWMAIESIRDRVFSTQSDIWSFGIVLWEFFTLAKTPYPGMEAEKQYQRLVEGYRMEQPEYATDQVYNIILKCWKAKPTLRPTFTNLVASIGDLLESSVKEHYVDLNAPYLDMNTMTLESGKSDYLTMMSAPDHEGLSSPPTCDYVNSPCLSSVTVAAAAAMTADDRSYHPIEMSRASIGSSQRSESGIFSPRSMPTDGDGVFEFSTTNANNSDSESEAVELSPMLNHDYQEQDDNYEKPINVHQRRAEFTRQREAAAMKISAENNPLSKIQRANDSDMGYCNTRRNRQLIDLNDATDSSQSKVDGKMSNNQRPKEGYVTSIIKTQDNYVNMPRQKHNVQKDGQASFSNPSYIIMGNNRNLEHL